LFVKYYANKMGQCISKKNQKLKQAQGLTTRKDSSLVEHDKNNNYVTLDEVDLDEIEGDDDSVLSENEPVQTNDINIVELIKLAPLAKEEVEEKEEESKNLVLDEFNRSTTTPNEIIKEDMTWEKQTKGHEQDPQEESKSSRIFPELCFS